MFVYPASFSCASQSIDIDSVVIKNIRNMHAVSTKQAANVCILTIMNQIKYISFSYIFWKHHIASATQKELQWSQAVAFEGWNWALSSNL